MSTATILLGIIFVALYAAFLIWYGGQGKPLSAREVDNLLAEMQKRAGKPAQTEEEAPLLKQFRELAKSDDGGDGYWDSIKSYNGWV